MPKQSDIRVNPGDLVYVYIGPRRPPSSIARTDSFQERVLLDYDAEGELIGVEILA